MSRESYDAVPYPARAFFETHPQNLQTVATVYGLTPPPIETARVLELGCAGGGNIIPMAYALPGATFVGIDYSPRQIEDAKRVADAVGVNNLALHATSITDITPDFGRFDYIIAHGVFSWVPHDVQEAIFRVGRENLSEHGVTYVSFNVFPGGYTQLWLREMLMFHAPPGSAASGSERVRHAHEFFDVAMQSLRAHGHPSADVLSRGMIPRDQPEAQILHELFEDSNEPMYFQDFARRAGEHGLQYLADAGTNEAPFEQSIPVVKALLDSIDPQDVIRREQYLDFLRGNQFRRALLVHSDRVVDRKRLRERVEQLFVLTMLQTDAPPDAIASEQQPVEFVKHRGPGLTVKGRLNKVVLAAICDAHPRAVRVGELIDRAAEALKIPAADLPAQRARAVDVMLGAWLTGVLVFYVTPPPRARLDAGERPEASTYARYQCANRQRQLINLRHEVINMPDAMLPLLQLLDGTRTRAQLADAVIASNFLGPPSQFPNRSAMSDAARRTVEEILQNGAKYGLLVG